MTHPVLITASLVFFFATAAAGADGKTVYEKSCATCHDGGLAGAPELGNEQAWQQRLEKGMDTLVQHAIEGFKSMPARGGNPSLNDSEIEAAVKYMAGQGR